MRLSLNEAEANVPEEEPVGQEQSLPGQWEVHLVATGGAHKDK